METPQPPEEEAVTATDRERAAALRHLPESLWQHLRADPARAPEIIALAAADRHGPAAQAWVSEMRARYSYGPEQLAKMAKRKHAQYARLGGAATGFGGFVTVVPDLAGLAWIQSRLVFFVAAAYGFDPRDAMRPAELLVLQDVYPDVTAARAALDGAGRSMTAALIDRQLSRGDREQLTRKLLSFVGTRVAKRYAGKLVPGLAVVVNSVGNERAVRALADRSIRFYGG